ncbi:MAG: hypothetical protein LAN84_09790 [Acidobacteriia bacterium]|nr:hypothetical protein [Terriglobia bacterium]
MATDKNRIDELVEIFRRSKEAADAAEEDLSKVRERIITLVLKEGQVPARAAKTLALRGEEYELRVSRPVEVTVDARRVRILKLVCLRAGAGRITGKLFRKVETYVLADGADEIINQAKLPEHAPRNLRSLFARALRVRELAPQLEIRELRPAQSKVRKAGEEAA